MFTPTLHHVHHRWSLFKFDFFFLGCICLFFLLFYLEIRVKKTKLKCLKINILTCETNSHVLVTFDSDFCDVTKSPSLADTSQRLRTFVRMHQKVLPWFCLQPAFIS